MQSEHIGWLGVTALFKRVRSEGSSVIDMPNALIEGAYTSTGGTYNKRKTIIHTMDKELYSYLASKTKQQPEMGLVNGIKSGFEVFRIIVRVMDPITKSTKQGLLMQFMNKN